MRRTTIGLVIAILSIEALVSLAQFYFGFIPASWFPNQEFETGLFSSGPIVRVVTWTIAQIHRYSNEVIAIATSLLFIYTALLWRSTASLVGQSKITVQKQLRAYLGIKAAFIRFVGPSHIRVTIQIQNTGQTPAHNVRKNAWMFIKDPANLSAFDSVPLEESRMPLVPGASWMITYDQVNFQDEIASDVAAERKAL